jgi:hypothetical protein
MNSVDEEQREEEPAPSCALRFQRVLKDYIAEQRELIDKFRRARGSLNRTSLWDAGCRATGRYAE